MVLSTTLVKFMGPAAHRRLRTVNKMWNQEIVANTPIYRVPTTPFHRLLRAVALVVSHRVYWSCVRAVSNDADLARYAMWWIVDFPVTLTRPNVSIGDHVMWIASSAQGRRRASQPHGCARTWDPGVHGMGV